MTAWQSLDRGGHLYGHIFYTRRPTMAPASGYTWAFWTTWSPMRWMTLSSRNFMHARLHEVIIHSVARRRKKKAERITPHSASILKGFVHRSARKLCHSLAGCTAALISLFQHIGSAVTPCGGLEYERATRDSPDKSCYRSGILSHRVAHF